MKWCGLAAVALGVATSVQAQESDWSVSVGARAWHTQWTTFSYDINEQGSRVLIQVEADDKTVVVPLLSARYGNFVASVSGYTSTGYRFTDGNRNTRSELDANVGYLVLPTVAVTLGYKKVAQKGEYRYEPAGWVAGVSATAPLGGAFSLYGSLGLGRLKTPSSNDVRDVQFDADYRLTEVGFAYGLAPGGMPKALTFTLGYRMQVLDSKDALDGRDGRDLTQGLTLGVVATF